MIDPQKIAQARTAVMIGNHQAVYCPHCGKIATTQTISSKLAAVLIEVLDNYGKEEVRPGIPQEPANSDHKGSNRRRSGRSKKA